MFLVQKVCSKILAVNLTVCRVSSTFTLSGKEDFPEGSNVLNPETPMVPFILASDTLPKWTVTLNKLYSLVSYDIQTHKSSTQMKNNQQKPSYPTHQHTFGFFSK